ncbi:MAG TPA: hypothetical protein VFH39_03380 [Candidatus Saccharimonadales bacterium]|nr:hypothetical protein [Candidatus Saccharimonadales bacterium]
MNVASLELCKELYELSGWSLATSKWYESWGDSDWSIADKYNPNCPENYPAYDLGYLLRKLPWMIGAPRALLYMQKREKGYYYAYTTSTGEDWPFDERATVFKVEDTPEDSAAMLAIELFKQGVLSKSPTVR